MSMIKEPYVISVWEEELIPVQDWYVKGVKISEEQYNNLPEEEKKKYRPHSNLLNVYIREDQRLTSKQYEAAVDDFKSKYILQGNGDYEINGEIVSETVYQDKLKEFKEQYEKYTIIEHFEETQGVIIGSDNMESVYAAINPIFKENVNGSVELTFSIYYKVFDPDILDFSMNPFVSMLTNEAKIKLKFRNKWYDLIIKNCVEDSINYMFTYTCKDFYVNELSKNGFKVELDSELENNQYSVTELSKSILKDTDWIVDKNKSDILVETKVEPLYFGVLKYPVRIKKVNNYIPDVMVSTAPYPDGDPEPYYLPEGTAVLLFYSDIVDRKIEPQILAVFEFGKNDEPIYIGPDQTEKYLLDVNEDVIVNGCNYRILDYEYKNELHKVAYADSALKDNLINIIDLEGLRIYEHGRAEKVVRSQKTGYDPDMDRFISKYYKLDKNGEPDTEVEYYGYTKENILRTDLAENLLANSDNFTSTETGWVFDGVPEKRTKNKEAGYVGQIFQQTSITEANPDSGKLYEETVLELSLKNSEDYRYYKDTQGKYYYVDSFKKDDEEQPKYIEVESTEGKAFEENVLDSYKKLQREGTNGYGEKTDDEIETLANEHLSDCRYSQGSRVAINTGVAANRSKIQQLSPGEEYVFAVSLGKYKDGEEPPQINKLRDENGAVITYGADVPDAYYEFIEVDSSGSLAYNAADKAIKEYETEIKNGAMKYYLENTTYKGLYSETYNATYEQCKKEYKERYLRTAGFSNDRTKKNWQPGGRRKAKALGLWGEWIGYYEIFLNVLRGFKPEDSEEECCDPNFLQELHKSLLAIDPKKDAISKQLYEAFISGTTEEPDKEGKMWTYYQGLYPSMVMNTMLHSQDRSKQVIFTMKSAYEIMGYDKGMYPNYDDKTNSLVNMTDSFNEFLFSEFYYAILNKWLIVPQNKETAAGWGYTAESKGDLSSLLKSTYKACYENTNTIFESMEYAKKYHMPTALNAKGGEYYQIHEATWVVKANQTAEARVKEEEAIKGFFKAPFTGEDPACSREDFILAFCGAEADVDQDGNITGYTKYSNNMADYCYQKEQDWLSTKTDTQVQSNDFIKQIKSARIKWIEEYIKKEIEESQNIPNSEGIDASYYGGSWYCANLLGKFYSHWDYETLIGTYTYNTDTYNLNLTQDNKADGSNGQINTYRSKKNTTQTYPSDTIWEPISYYTQIDGATHFAVKDTEEKEENKTGGYVFERDLVQVRLFDPHLDVLNATFIPQKDDDGAYVFDPFVWKYRPYRDWDSKEYRDPLTLEIDKNTGVPGDKVYHPLRLFDGHLGSWYDVPTRYNMVRKYEDPNIEKDEHGNIKYKYLTEDITIKEVGHYDGKDYEYIITYPKGYQYDVYVPEKRGKYILASEVSTHRLLDLNKDGVVGIRFSHNGNFFGDLFDSTIDKTKDFFDRLSEGFKKIFSGEISSFEELKDAFSHNKDNEEADKSSAGLANSNADSSGQYDEDRESVHVYTNSNGEEIGCPVLDEVANNSEFANAIQTGKAKPVSETKTRTTEAQIAEISKRYIKYKPYYWRHWGKDRYDYQPKICIQQTVDGIKTYKPYNNIEDKKSDAYFVYEIEKDNDGNPILPTKENGEAIPAENLIFLKDRKTTYRQRVETDYEAYKYRMKKVSKMNKSYWIEAPNGEDYLRKYKFGDGETKLFDGHLGRWVQCYSAFKVVENAGDPYYEEGANVDDYLDKFYMPYDNIMIPYNQRIFNATKKLTRIRKTYNGNNEEVYVLHNNIYMTLAAYLLEAGYECPLNYDGLKISFIDNYDYNSEKFLIEPPDPEKPRERYLEFELDSEKCQYMDLVVKENTITSDVVKERWAYWISPVLKAFALTENPLSKLGMLFETSWGADENDTSAVKDNSIGRYVFLGMQMFKHIPYKTALDKVIYAESLSEIEQTKTISMALQEVYDYYIDQTIQELKKKFLLLPEDEDQAAILREELLTNLNQATILQKNAITVSIKEENDNIDFILQKAILGQDPELITGDDKDEILGDAIVNTFDDIAISIVETFKKRLVNSPNAITFLNTAPSLYENNMTVFMVTYEDTNSIELNIQKIERVEEEIIPLFPGQAPNAENLHFTNYYIYDPDIVDHPDSAIFEYVGQDYSQNFAPAYDEDCQKIRSIKGKESNYFKLLQDCCDSFECWMRKDIEHNPTTGQINYYDKPVYTEVIDVAEGRDVEPQVFVGEEAKIEGTQKAAKRLHHKLFGKIEVETRNEGETDEQARKFHEHRLYKAIETLDEKEQKLLLQLNRINNLNFKIEYIRVPDKRIHFKRFVGEEKWNGFKYGVNLKHIKRTIDSNQFSTRIIVKQNSNEFAKDKFCTISRATENPIKENFILDFSYYINNKLLDNSDLIGDLYTDVNTRLNYYPKLASLNKLKNEAILKQSSLLVSLDNVTSKYETAVQLKEASLEEITKLTQLLTANYDTYGQVISVPWKYNKSQEYVQKRQTSTPGVTKTTSDVYGETTYTFEIAIPAITTVAEYPKYNDTMRTYLDQMDVYQREYTNAVKALEELTPEKERLEAELAEIQAYLEEIASKKNELNKLFYHKYSRYIQEGSWVDENYIDDNLYYLDALSVSRTSSKPKVTYDIGVVDVGAAYEYEEDRIVLESELGDRTYIEDTDFFGYRKDDYTKPYWELVIVTEKTYNITDPSQNQVKVKNYTTQFDDLFQRVAAASQTLQFNEGSYGRASTILNEDGTIKAEVLRESITDSDIILKNATNEDVKIDKTGVTITSPENRANVVKLVSAGILVSNDGGNHYATAITGDGINADLLLAGVINTDKLLIGGRTNPNFMWNKLGISSFKTDGDKIDYSSFVRMDQYGIYGIKNYSKDGRAPESMSINDAFEPIRLKDITNNPNAVFGLTWDGFFLNAANGAGKVTIGTGQDFRMSEYSDDQSRWIDRVVIGRLNSEDRYGFQLKNSNDQVVMETDDTGELYLKRKLRISNFGEEDTIQPYGWVYEGTPIEVNERVIVQKKDSNGDLIFNEQVDDVTGDVSYIPEMIEGIIETEVDGEKVTIPAYPKHHSENGIVTYTYETSLDSYYYKYETITQNNEEINVIRYYTIQEGALFATYPAPDNKNWKDDIKNQLDRISLGIVDTYSRSNNFKKVDLNGRYSSSEYLTKVFSVRSNAFVASEQFTEDNIDDLIGENENFAIFDNGNLFARNAWIEGNVNATSGSFINGNFVNGIFEDSTIKNSVIGNLTIEDDLILKSGRIRHQGEGNTIKWSIDGDGSAFFENVIVSGTIKSTIFEQNEVQTVAGGLLIAPGLAIKKVESNISREHLTNGIKITFNSSTLPTSKLERPTQTLNESTTEIQVREFETSAYAVISEKPNYSYDMNNSLIKHHIRYYGFEKDEDGQDVSYILIEKGTNIYDSEMQQWQYVLFLGLEGSIEEILGIVINASNEDNMLPKESISIIDINSPFSVPRAQFGRLSDKIFDTNSNPNNSVLTANMKNQYGLYCDNVYIKGAMVSETVGNNPYIAGITTTDGLLVKPPEKEENEHVVFFAGADLQQDENNLLKNLKFYVTKEGSLYASDGYFNGTIMTSKIIGSGSDYALEVTGNTNNAFHFSSEVDVKEIQDDGSGEMIEKVVRKLNVDFLSFKNTGSYFYNTSNSVLFSVLHGISDNNQFSGVRGIGMFGKGAAISDYKLNFTEDSVDKSIVLSYQGASLVKIDDSGLHFQYETDGLGENCRSFTVMDGNQVIGINFQLKNI